MGSSSSPDGTIHFAPYIEDYHERMMSNMDKVLVGNEGEGAIWFFKDAQYYPLGKVFSSPYAAYTVTLPDDAYLGFGYTVTSFPSVYDMFGKFTAGLDIEILHGQILRDDIYDGPINDFVDAAATYLNDEIDNVSLPRMVAGMRDINAVMSTGFLVEKTLIEDSRLKALAKTRSELQIKAMELGHQRWIKHLDWNMNTVKLFTDITDKMLSSEQNYLKVKEAIDVGNKLWSFTVLDKWGGMLGLLNNAYASSQHKTGGLMETIGNVAGGVSALAKIAPLIAMI